MDVPSTPPPRAVGVEDGDIELRPFSGASSLFSSVGADAGYLSDGAGDEDAAPAEPVVVAAPVYLTGVSLVLVAAAATMAVFLTMLDTSIVATAIPRITDEFHSVADIGWYSSVYQLSSAVFQPVAGKIYTKFNTKLSFVTFFLIFEAGSTLCALAKSSVVFITGRAIAGVRCAGLLNGALTISSSIVHISRRASLTGLMMGLSQLGVVLGPLVGGAFTSYSTWRLCFYINLPLGALIAGFLSFVNIPEQMQKASPLTVLKNLPSEMDLVGVFLLLPSATMLLLALQLGGLHYPWGSATIIVLFVASGVGVITWILWSIYYGAAALIPCPIFRKQSVFFGSVTQWCAMSSLYTASYYLPLYFQTVRGMTPMASGYSVLPSIITQVFCALACGIMVEKTGYVIPYALFGAVCSTLSNGLFGGMNQTTPVVQWAGYQILNGIGRGFMMQMPLLAAQMSLPPEHMAIGVGIIVFFGMFGSAVTLAIANTIFGEVLRHSLTNKLPADLAHRVFQAGAMGFRNIVHGDDLKLAIESYVGANNHVFYFVGGFSILSAFTALFLGWQDIRVRAIEALSA